MIVGSYGSGKTEVSVNLAKHLRAAGKEVTLADLDIVNPYFRCREAQALMESLGVRLVIPPGSQRYADLPIVLPEIKGMLKPRDDVVSLFDVGGDEVGATMLSSLREALGDSPYQLLQVLNARRPFTDTLDGCLKMKEQIERASRLTVTGFVANTHLIEETTVETVLEGYRLAAAVSKAARVPLVFVTAMGSLAEQPEIRELPVPVFPLERVMLPPWLRYDSKSDTSRSPEAGPPMPAGRVKPIFQP